MKKVVANEDWCIGCKLCEVNCLTAHSASRDMIKAHRKESPKQVPRVVVEEGEDFSFAVNCRHCEDAPCVKACITGAMHRDPHTGLVNNDTTRCIGCWTCILVCPYGAIMRHEGDKKVAAKCDLCVNFGEPACVAGCPNNALSVKEDEA
jgi:anaerobic carbon-monoxide dehydrogenase iron sulfur subunit